jgi:hypothetical protein
MTMKVTTLVSEGGNGNHSVEQWAHVTTDAIMQLDPQIEADRKQQAEALINGVERVFAAYYRTVMGKEAEALAMFHDRCDTSLQIAVEGLAEDSLKVIQEIALGTPWEDTLREPQWVDAAYATICSYMATAAHIERLLYADKHPKNAAAAAYKLQYQG